MMKKTPHQPSTRPRLKKQTLRTLSAEDTARANGGNGNPHGASPGKGGKQPTACDLSRYCL